MQNILANFATTIRNDTTPQKMTHTPTANTIAAVLLGAALLASCNNSALRHATASGMAAQASTAQEEQTTPQVAATTDDAKKGIELPAPLKGTPEQILQRDGYTVSYNTATRLPNWVAWHLTADRLTGNANRKGIDFEEDTDVPSPRATDSDYSRSGYDRGHMCPAGDNKWSKTAMRQSFLFTNICPQAPSLNRGDWNEMELACRKWAKNYGGLYIVCGPILYKGKHKTIGRNKVTVPEAFFKVVLCLTGAPKAIGFIYKNTDGNRPKGDYANTVDEVERITGIDFFASLPDDVERKVEAQCDIDAWDLAN